MKRQDFAPCDKAPDGEHDWIETSTVNDAGERFVCKWCSHEALEPMQSDANPLTPEEVRELDDFGELRGAQLIGVAQIPARALELWEREILYGRVEPDPRRANGILGLSIKAR